MKKIILFVLVLACVLNFGGCSNQDENINTQYYFSAKVLEVQAEYLLLEIFYTGNSNYSDGAKVEVSTDVISADGCPAFVVDEYARVVLARDADDNPPGRLEALAIYKTDETGNVTAD
jgi:hypothetical protein